MRESIPGVEEKDYFNPYSDSLGEGAEVHSVL